MFGLVSLRLLSCELLLWGCCLCVYGCWIDYDLKRCLLWVSMVGICLSLLAVLYLMVIYLLHCLGLIEHIALTFYFVYDCWFGFIYDCVALLSGCIGL